MSDIEPKGRIDYVIVYDILRVLPNGNRVTVCYHNTDTLGGFSTLELAVNAKSQMYAFFSECGVKLEPDDLEITPVLTSVTVLPSAKDDTSAVNVWNKGPGSSQGTGLS